MLGWKKVQGCEVKGQVIRWRVVGMRRRLEYSVLPYYIFSTCNYIFDTRDLNFFFWGFAAPIFP